MARTPPEIVAKLNAVNHWLEDVYGPESHISGFLSRSGFSQEDINKIKTNHLAAFIEATLDYIRSVADGHDGVRRNSILVRHYGLISGQAETLQAIGDDLGLSRERIRQLCSKRLSFFRHKKAKAEFEAELVAIGERLLGK
jgi:DNA-directed RNA polymerase sigma subunit (sigma70/sigma32)